MTINFSDHEIQIISSSSSWNDERLKPIKKKIKAYNLGKQKNMCCYCRKSFHGEAMLDIDIEHILPKNRIGGYPEHMLSLTNLSVSCKRCNMAIKGKKTDFIKHKFKIKKQPFLKSNYKFIHPNLDNYSDHIKKRVHQEDDDIMVIYSVVNNSSKGEFTRTYFRLSELEVNTFNQAQNIEDTMHTSLSKKLIKLSK